MMEGLLLDMVEDDVGHPIHYTPIHQYNHQRA